MSNLIAIITATTILGGGIWAGSEYLLPLVDNAKGQVAAMSSHNDLQHEVVASHFYWLDKGHLPASNAELLAEGNRYLDLAAKEQQLAALNAASLPRDGDWVMLPITQADCTNLQSEGKLTEGQTACGEWNGGWYFGVYAPIT